jgi:predicted O-methyltransferase YrrM
MNLIQHTSQYCRFLLSSTSPAGTGIPVLEAILGRKHQKGFGGHFAAIRELRGSLMRNHDIIAVRDYGAGHAATPSEQRRISGIAKGSTGSRKFSLLHYNLVKHLAPANILELGTSFGFTTSVIATAAPFSRVVTIEGCNAIAAIAATNFRQLGIRNIRQVVGPFETALEKVLEEHHPLDYIFFDGNHKKNPTLNYFLQALPHRSEQAVFVFDDIRWSKPMTEAWEEICRHPDISLSVDLYSAGILFFDKQLPRRHVKVRY